MTVECRTRTDYGDTTHHRNEGRAQYDINDTQ